MTQSKGACVNSYENYYFDWLIGYVPSWSKSHRMLLRKLYDTPFRVTMLMDENRVGDGLALRNRFDTTGNRLLLARPCRVLEVMLAMAVRFEEEYIPHYEDEAPIERWFTPMIFALGLQSQNDNVFDPFVVERALRCLLDHGYSPEGKGGLFYVPGTEMDMRYLELWQQMLIWMEANEGGLKQ